jgi:hypothetical protein
MCCRMVESLPGRVVARLGFRLKCSVQALENIRHVFSRPGEEVSVRYLDCGRLQSLNFQRPSKQC